jgi:hypothetical protein
MPYINLNGQLVEVTQEQFEIYTIGQNQSVGTTQNPTESAAAVAAGGTVTVTSTGTAQILTPDTTNNTPGQTLTTSYQPVTTSAADTNYGASVQKFDDGTTLQTFDDGSVLATTTDGSVTATDAPVDSAVDPQSSLAPGETIVSASDVNTSASTTTDPYAAQDAENGANAGTGTTNTGTGTSADGAAASANIQGLVQGAQQQQTIADQRKQINNGDWRVRLRLAPQANYLYKSPTPGIMKPLAVTDGIIFPYTPQIDTNYRANYETYDLTHSNYRGYFYKNSYVDAINLKATFTAQDTADANYLLAVITFLKSVTKMFYGQDAQRGAPPPVVYLTGLGDYQFREHSCLVSQFTYTLPDNVDYIRAGSPNNVGLNLTSIRDRQSVATNSIFGSLNRLANAFLTKGAITGPAAPPTLGLNRPTYVPTKMDISLTLLPIQSRQQVSKQFSVKEFANGNLIKGGFW